MTEARQHHVQIDEPFVMVPLWLVESVGPRALQVWAAIASHASPQKPQPFPGRQTLGKRLGCSAETIDRAVAELRISGALTVTRRGKNRTNLYTLHMRRAKPDDAGLVTDDDSVPSNDPSEMTTPGVVTNDDSGVVTVDDSIGTRTRELEPPEPEPDIAPQAARPTSNGSAIVPKPDASPATRERNPYFDAVVGAMGYMPTRSGELAMFASIAKQCREGGHDPDEIPRRVLVWYANYPDVSLTTSTLLNRWDWLGSIHANANPLQRRKMFEELRRRAEDNAFWDAYQRAAGNGAG